MSALPSDPIMDGLDAHMSAVQAAYAREEWIEQRAEQLLAADWSPWTGENLSEAIGEADDECLNEVATALGDNNLAWAAMRLKVWAAVYWTSRALGEAEKQYQEF